MDSATALNGLQRLVNFHLGGSLYLMPFIFAAAGSACSVLMILACAILTLFVYELIAHAAITARQGSFGNIVAHILGPRSAGILRLMVVLNALGVVLAYLQTVLDVYWAVGGRLNASAQFDTLAIFFLVTFVLGLLATVALDVCFGHMADWGSLIANAALLALIVLFMMCPSAERSQCQAVVPSETWSAAVFRFAHSLIFAFTSAEYVLYACSVADDQGKLLEGVSSIEMRYRVRCIGGASVMMSAFLYMAVGFSGWSTFGQCVSEDILSNLAPRDAPAGWAHAFTAVLAVNALSLVLSFPVFVQTLLLYLREFFLAHVPGKLSVQLQSFFDPDKTWTGIAWVVPVACLLVQYVPGLQWIIDLVCSWTDVFFMFVFPPLMFIIVPLEGWAQVPRKMVSLMVLLSALSLNLAKLYGMI